MVHMQNVQKAYRTDAVETQALRDIDLRVVSGEFIAVMGPSGCGKTTLLNVLGLLDTFDAGSYQLDSQDVSRLSDSQRSRIRNEKIGFIFQSFNLIPDLNVFDNVDVPLRYRGLRAGERRRAIEDALQQVGLAKRARHYPGQLSGGQQQRVAIARALVGRPKLILADEPTGNLDTQMAADILGLLEEINRAGTTLIMVTHDPQLAARAGRIIRLLDGRIVDEEEASLPQQEEAAREAAC